MVCSLLCLSTPTMTLKVQAKTVRPMSGIVSWQLVSNSSSQLECGLAKARADSVAFDSFHDQHETQSWGILHYQHELPLWALTDQESRETANLALAVSHLFAVLPLPPDDVLLCTVSIPWVRVDLALLCLLLWWELLDRGFWEHC